MRTIRLFFICLFSLFSYNLNAQQEGITSAINTLSQNIESISSKLINVDDKTIKKYGLNYSDVKYLNELLKRLKKADENINKYDVSDNTSDKETPVKPNPPEPYEPDETGENEESQKPINGNEAEVIKLNKLLEDVLYNLEEYRAFVTINDIITKNDNSKSYINENHPNVLYYPKAINYLYELINSIRKKYGNDKKDKDVIEKHIDFLGYRFYIDKIDCTKKALDDFIDKFVTEETKPIKKERIGSNKNDNGSESRTDIEKTIEKAYNYLKEKGFIN